jgi:hypothetical protein
MSQFRQMVTSKLVLPVGKPTAIQRNPGSRCEAEAGRSAGPGARAAGTGAGRGETVC